MCIDALLLWQISLKGNALQTKNIKEKIKNKIKTKIKAQSQPAQSMFSLPRPTKMLRALRDVLPWMALFTSIWNRLHYWSTSRRWSLNHYLNHRKEDFLCLCNLSPVQRRAGFLQPSTVTAQAGTLCCSLPSSAAIARHDLYMKILRSFSNNFSWPKQLHCSSCKFTSCSCIVRCIINCLHPPSHPSPTTLQQNCQIRFIIIKL